MEDLLLWSLATSFVFYLITRINIYIYLTYLRNGSDDHVAVTVTLLSGIVVYNLRAPLIEVTQEPIPWLRSVLEAPSGRTEVYTDRERRFIIRFLEIYTKHPDKLRRFIRTSRRFFRQYRRIVNGLMLKLICEKLYWRTEFGSEHADLTGLMTGALWALKGLFVTSFRERCKVISKPQIQVIPAFGQNKFETELQCIFRIRLGNVINAVFSLIKSIREGAMGSDGASHPKLDENRNGEYQGNGRR